MPSTTANDIIQSTTQQDAGGGQGTNLTELILERIAAHEATQTGQPVVQGAEEPEVPVELPGKVMEVYSKYTALQKSPTICALTASPQNRVAVVKIQEWSAA